MHLALIYTLLTRQVLRRPSSGLAAPSRQAVHAYRAPLLARVHLRLGLWSWTAEVHIGFIIESDLPCIRKREHCPGRRRCAPRGAGLSVFKGLGHVQIVAWHTAVLSCACLPEASGCRPVAMHP